MTESMSQAAEGLVIKVKRIKEYYITIIIVTMIVVVNIGAFAAYMTNVKASLSEQTNSHVDDIMDEAVVCINLKLDEEINTMKTIARLVASLNQHTDSSSFLSNVLEEQSKASGYDVLELVGTDGAGTVTGNNYAKKKYYTDAMKGKTVIQEETEGKTVTAVALASPVYDSTGESVSAVLIARMDIKSFSEKIEISSLNQNGKVFVVKRDGMLISKSEGLSNAVSINDIFTEKKYEDKLIRSMRSRNSGIINYESKNTKRYIGYSKLSYNKWYVVSVISSNAVQANAGDVETDVIILGVELAFILLVLLIYLIYNIVNIKKREKINLERYFIATKYADTIMLDYSVMKDTMYCNDKWKELFGYSLPKANVREGIKEHIVPEDIAVFEENVSRLTENGHDVEFEIRVSDKDGAIRLCQVKLFPIYEKSSKKVKKAKLKKIIGLIESEDK